MFYFLIRGNIVVWELGLLLNVIVEFVTLQ